jgi:sphingomyelin phosphodiesterase acid-like 3
MRNFIRSAIAATFLLLLSNAAARAQTAPKPDAGTVPVLMLSDIHFDPFRDPAKAAKLAAAPVAEWEAILKQPNSPTQAADFAALQKTCGATKGLDSDHTLFTSALEAARTHAASAKFVTISGDLLVHQFDCRFQTLVAKPGLNAFAAKTVSYVVKRVEASFPGVPVYVALGNNDSGCGDYKLDEDDTFFAGSSDAILQGLHGASPAELTQAREDYDKGAYFAVTLPPPMVKTRLLVFDDMYLSRSYKTCGGKADPKGSADVTAWLSAQLDQARQRGEKVWVMAHIPTGIDVFSTLKKGDVCAGTPDTFLSTDANDALVNMLVAHDGQVKLAIVGHTHMDEMKLLTREDGSGGVPVKGVASISPVNSNLPSITVARIDPKTAEMADYAVYVSSNKTGVDAKWAREYSFDQAFGETTYSAAALGRIAAGFHADPTGAAAKTQAYEMFFDPGFPISPLLFGWPQYACGIDHSSAASFKACVCAAKPAP